MSDALLRCATQDVECGTRLMRHALSEKLHEVSLIRMMRRMRRIGVDGVGEQCVGADEQDPRDDRVHTDQG